jgi:hypothetical protein
MGTSEHFQNGQPDRGCPVEKCGKPNNDGLLSGCPVAKGDTTGPDERGERNRGEPARSTPRTGLAPRAVDHLAREFSELKTGSFAELEDALRSRLAKYVPPEAVDVEVERVVRRIEALVGVDDTVVSFPAHVGAAKPYEVIEPASAGEKCFRCGKSGGVMQIKHGGEVNLFHPDCADFHFAARVDPPVKVPDLGPDPYDDHGAPRAGSVPFMITQAQKRLLRAHGYSDEDIANLTPQQAHEILTQEGRQPNA